MHRLPTRSRSWSRLARLASLSAVALGLSAGCVDNDLSIVITGNYALDPKSCQPPSVSASTLRVPLGLLDVGLAFDLGRGYMMVPNVQNELPSMVPEGIEINNVFLVGWDVQIIAPTGSALASVLKPNTPNLTTLSLPDAGGVLTAGGGTSVGALEVFPVNAAAAVLSQVKAQVKKNAKTTLVPVGGVDPGQPLPTVTVRLRARTIHGGANLFSNWFEFPLQLCAFCLASKPDDPSSSGYSSASVDLLECPDPMVVPLANLSSACLPQQDAQSTCCLHGRSAVCGQAVPHATTGTGM